MTYEHAKKLKVGDRLIWRSDGCKGQVTEVNDYAARVVWDDGQRGALDFHDFTAIIRDLSVSS